MNAGHLDICIAAHEHGGTWDAHTCSKVASYGHMDCLVYAYDNGCPWDESTCSSAALHGHLDCLSYCHDNGRPWDERTCSSAACNGHLGCLTYAHKHGCPWNKLTCGQAVLHGHIDCLTYAHEHGCPWDSDTWSDVDTDELPGDKLTRAYVMALDHLAATSQEPNLKLFAFLYAMHMRATDMCNEDVLRLKAIASMIAAAMKVWTADMVKPPSFKCKNGELVVVSKKLKTGASHSPMLAEIVAMDLIPGQQIPMVMAPSAKALRLFVQKKIQPYDRVTSRLVAEVAHTALGLSALDEWWKDYFL
eukprot:gene17722-24082_t